MEQMVDAVAGILSYNATPVGLGDRLTFGTSQIKQCRVNMGI